MKEAGSLNDSLFFFAENTCPIMRIEETSLK